MICKICVVLLLNVLIDQSLVSPILKARIEVFESNPSVPLTRLLVTAIVVPVRAIFNNLSEFLIVYGRVILLRDRLLSLHRGYV